ncbi:hypothetical protein AZF08_21710 [Bacillus gaemokensis]|nr:hypothetical protein AZF08_21710 [Bacillus gaemokensis]
MQAYLTATCQNMKKIALHLTKKGQMKGCFLYFYHFFAISIPLTLNLNQSVGNPKGFPHTLKNPDTYVSRFFIF